MKTTMFISLLAVLFLSSCSSGGGRRGDSTLIQEQAACRSTRTCNR